MECDCEDELLERDREIEMLSDESETWRERAERAEAAIERVRELHRKETRRSGWEVCTHCEVGMLQDPVDWPCDTIAALDAGNGEQR